MNNPCNFSTCRRFRYTLEHVFEPLMHAKAPRRIMWIGLNPSTADENQLDPTLRRIRRFSADWGFTSFVMTNLFAFRATKPTDMKRAEDPVGPFNNHYLHETASQCEKVVACWGAHGSYRERNHFVFGLLYQAHPLLCLGRNGDGSPRHPLYVAASTQLEEFTP